jgi:exosortase
MALLYLLLYAPLYPGLVETWINDSNNSHGLLIPLVSLFLAWRLREKLDAGEPRTPVFGLTLLVLSLLAYLASYVGDLAFPARMTMITTLAGLILFNYGWGIFGRVLFPVLFLIFMVPVPDTLLDLVGFPLQLSVSNTSAHLIDLFGMPVYADGNLLHFPRYSFEVTEACSGIRSLVSFLAIGTLLAYMNGGGRRGRALLILSTVPLALFVNLMRVTGTGILANYFGPKVAQGFLHEFSGFAVFGSGILLMVGEMWVLNKVRFINGTSG